MQCLHFNDQVIITPTCINLFTQMTVKTTPEGPEPIPIIITRMRSSRMHTTHFSGCLSCHTCPRAMHARCHVCPLLCTPPPCMHAPLPHTPLWTEGMKHSCENITFPQLLLWAVIIVVVSKRKQQM